jgi:glyoxylase I family protein
MKIEHFAINVADPIAMADWYVSNMGMTIVRKSQSLSSSP